MMPKLPSRMTLCALALAGGSLFSPISITGTSAEAYACLPDEIPTPELLSAAHEDGSIPLGSDLILKVDGSFDDTDATVSVDGVEIEADILLKRLYLSSMIHVMLPENLTEGAEITLSFPNGLARFSDDPALTLTYTVGAAIEASTTELSEVNFDVIHRSEYTFNSCDALPQQTYFFVGGTDLDTEWLYADFVVGGSRETRLIDPDFFEGLLVVSITHDELEMDSIAEQSAGLTLYDVYGRQFSIRTTEGCREIRELADPEDLSMSLEVIDVNEAGCGLGGDYLGAELGLDPDPTPFPDPDPTTDPDPNPDPEGDERDQPHDDPQSESSREDLEDNSGCEQSETSQATSIYLLALAGLMSLFSRRRSSQRLT